MREEEKSEVRCEKCIHYESHIKAIAEGKLGDAFCMLECNENHSAFEEKKIMLSDEEKAEEYIDNLDLVKERNPELKTNDDFIKQAHLDGLAEGRKKSKLYIEQLQNEKAELAEDFCKQLEELKAQIEKMKSCNNCKHRMLGYPFCTEKTVIYSHNPYKKIGIKSFCENMNKWELAE